MAVFTLDLKSKTSYEFTTTLEQETYRIKLNWSNKEDAWYFNLYDRFSNPLILGHKLLYGNLILGKHHANASVPQGEFLLLKGISGEPTRPSFKSVSEGDTLYYITSDELR